MDGSSLDMRRPKGAGTHQRMFVARAADRQCNCSPVAVSDREALAGAGLAWVRADFC